MVDDTTKLVNVTVTNAAESADLTVTAGEATANGAYTLTITRKSDSKKWTIAVTVEGNL